MRILHFSDFHITKDGIESADASVTRMIDAIKRHVKDENQIIDFILFTGDMVDQGGRSFNSLEEGLSVFSDKIIKKLCSELNVPEYNFFVCPGNHDVHRDSINKEMDYELEQTLDSPEVLHKFLSGNRNPGFSERLKKYDESFRQKWLEQVLSNSKIIHKTTVKLADHFIVEADGRKIGISCLNSAWRCGVKIDKKKVEKKPKFKLPNCIISLLKRIGFTPVVEEKIEYVEKTGEYNSALIGATQINDAQAFFNNTGVSLKVALAHHHFSVLGEADWHNLDSVLRRNYDICFFGHTHSARTDQHTNIEGSMVCSIAPSTKRENEMTTDGFKNGFSLWNIDIAKGTAKVQKFGMSLGSKFIPDQSIYTYILDRQLILPLKDFMEEFKNRINIDSVDLNKLRNRIIKTPTNETLIYGVSGIGKTYQITKALSELRDTTVYYCEAKIDESGGELISELQDKLSNFFNTYKNGYLIFDNCNVSILQGVINLRNRAKSYIKIFGITNEYNEHDFRFSGISTIYITPEDSKSAVDNYVDTYISDLRSQNLIKRFASGYPIIAIKLVKQALSSNELYPSIESIGFQSLTKSLGRDVKASKDLEELLIVMSLFQPFPKLADDSMVLWKMKSLSTLHSKSREEIVTLIEQARTIWHGALLESTPSGYTIRPYILAVYLASKWFDTYNSEEHFTQFIEELETLKEEDKSVVISAFSRRLSDLNKSDGAKALFYKLNEVNGFFRSENVVFSNLGSQLILAATSVNPAPLASSLLYVISSASEERLRSLNYIVRRNLVFALTYLIFYVDSFEDALLAMGIMAFYEEEDILNNASRTYQSTWHIIMPGTQVSLSQRVSWLKKYSQSNPKIKTLIPLALKGAFAAGLFSRMNTDVNCDKFSDYNPTYNEIEDYWRECTDLAYSEIDSGLNIKSYVDIVNSNIHLWCKRGLLPFAMGLIEKVARLDKGGWRILENDYNHIIKVLGESEVAKRIGKLKNIIVLSDFMSRLKSRQQDYYESSYSVSDFETEIQFYTPLAMELIESCGYKDEKLLSQFINDNHFVYISFCLALERNITDSQLEEMFNVILSLDILENDLVTPFLLSLVSCMRSRESINDFVEGLYQKGLLSIYTALLSRIESDNLSSLKKLEIKFQITDFNYFPIYLHHVSTSETILVGLLPELTKRLDKNMNEVMFYIATHYSFITLSPDAMNMCKNITMRFDLNDSYPNLTQSYCHFVCKLLNQLGDPVYAKQISKKLLSVSDDVYDSHYFTDVFNVILDKYMQDGLEILLEAMIDAPFHSVPYRLAEALGSGFGFGKGKLFTIDESFLYCLLEKYGVKLARVYARICPIFPKAPYESDGFSDWVTIILDKFGDDKEMRDNLSINMGSYMWSGSIIPLLDAKIRGFSQLRNHERPEVRRWIQDHLNQLKVERQNELIKEDFQAQLYG